jgi:hypothetical protein
MRTFPAFAISYISISQQLNDDFVAVDLNAPRVFCDADTPLGKCDIELSMLSREQCR